MNKEDTACVFRYIILLHQKPMMMECINESLCQLYSHTKYQSLNEE